jgi:FMN-dependent NADH-azoreductase
MATLLSIDSSGRIDRSHTRSLTKRFRDAWAQANPGGEIRYRDVGTNPPPVVSPQWIAAAFTPAGLLSAEHKRALQYSDEAVDELMSADEIVLGVPMYNFGMPAQLKAYFDQIVRNGRTFQFQPGTSDPYIPLLRSRPVTVITSVGDNNMNPGGTMYSLNFLEPHLTTIFGFIGIRDLTFVRVGDDEHQSQVLQRTLSEAEVLVERIASRRVLQPV